MRITVLGCGGSGGVPLIGNDWGRCDPSNPRNRRRRSSILVEQGGATILVDMGPDLREQLLTADVRRVDAILLTHEHADHLHGIDEVRSLNWLMRKGIDVYGDARTIEIMKDRFGYCFRTGSTNFSYPVLVPHVVDGAFTVAGVPIQPFVQDHGYSESLGFRFGRFAYSTDVVQIDPRGMALLRDLDVWIVDATRREPHPVHAHLDRTLEWIADLKPGRAYLTHMNHTMDYDTLMAELPAGVEPAYDGLVIEVPDAG